MYMCTGQIFSFYFSLKHCILTFESDLIKLMGHVKTLLLQGKILHLTSLVGTSLSELILNNIFQVKGIEEFFKTFCVKNQMYCEQCGDEVDVTMVSLKKGF